MYYKYVIIGGGMTGDAAIGGIREVDPNGSIGLFGAENESPYDRPHLSKGLWKDESLDDVWRDTNRAGDVANYQNEVLGRRIRIEHEDNANTMGAAAGKTMAGVTEPFSNVPYFWSDMFEIGYEAMGYLDSSMDTVADWKDEFKEGVVYYTEGTRVRGVLLWNIWDRWGPAGELVADPGPFTSEDLEGKIQW